MVTNIMVYIPELEVFLKAEEGTGDNLFDEDIAEGYVDYIYINTYVWDGDDLIVDDGGMKMLRGMFRDIYKDDDGIQLIEDSIRYMYDKVYKPYVIIKQCK